MPIDRAAVVRRHNPHTTAIDPFAALSVGNGEFAFTADITGLQTLPAAYAAFPLGTTAHWAWHRSALPAGLSPAAFRDELHDTHGRPVPYATRRAGQEELFDALRTNPHRLHLGRIGLDGVAADDLSAIDQRLDLWTGLLTSRFALRGQPFAVQTTAHGDRDAVAFRLSRAWPVALAFPYGSPEVDMADWSRPSAHETRLVHMEAREAVLSRHLDDDVYYVRLSWSDGGQLVRTGPHQFVLQGAEELVAEFALSQPVGDALAFDACAESSRQQWAEFWQSGAALDLGGCTDPRAPELERRIVLSQYQTAIHCAGSLPSAETGLLHNSWYGKFHLEMHWWHSVHFAVWSRYDRFRRPMGYYARILDQARALARRQGYAGARWPKMVGPDGLDAPSPVGPLLIWQQPHPIYYAELCYRRDPGPQTLAAWATIVDETAEFMASYATPAGHRGPTLGPPLKPACENQPADTCANPTFELSYWRFGLRLAQVWRERRGLPREAAWDTLLAGLPPLPVADGCYLMQEGLTDTWSRFNWEHPTLVGPLGMLPGDGVDPETMRRTVRRVLGGWQWDRCWGWDFPMVAMAAARCGEPELAVDALLVDSPKNRYLPNGHCYQRPALAAYLPGNGGLLAAVGMMSGGWTGAGSQALPGWPRTGWAVEAEGFQTWL